MIFLVIIVDIQYVFLAQVLTGDNIETRECLCLYTSLDRHVKIDLHNEQPIRERHSCLFLGMRYSYRESRADPRLGEPLMLYK